MVNSGGGPAPRQDYGMDPIAMSAYGYGDQMMWYGGGAPLQAPGERLGFVGTEMEKGTRVSAAKIQT